jgi:hypothetical protein
VTPLVWRALKSAIGSWVGAKRYDSETSVHYHIINPYHAVSIIAPAGACELARSLHRRRFLSREAPRLPLRGCPREGTCRCNYKHHDDRRARLRRAAERPTAVPRPGPPWSGQERRRSPGRRATDLI